MSKNAEEVVAAIVRANQILKAHNIAIQALVMSEDHLNAVFSEFDHQGLLKTDPHYRDTHRGFTLPMIGGVDIIPVSAAFWKSTYGR